MYNIMISEERKAILGAYKEGRAIQWSRDGVEWKDCYGEPYVINENFQFRIKPDDTVNMFENAKFGDKFLTRDGRIAIYHRYETRNNLNLHVLFVANYAGGLYCENNGLYAGNHIDFPEWDDDIVSKYHGEIDEEKIEELAEKCYEPIMPINDWIDAFKAGYRKAKGC